MLPKQKECKALLLDGNDSPLYELEQWKRQMEKQKQLSEECKEETKTVSRNTRQQDDCLRLRHDRNHLGSKLGAYWALSEGFIRGFTTCIFSTL